MRSLFIKILIWFLVTVCCRSGHFWRRRPYSHAIRTERILLTIDRLMVVDARRAYEGAPISSPNTWIGSTSTTGPGTT